MKIKMVNSIYTNVYRYNTKTNELHYTQEQYNYVFKYLDFEKLDKDSVSFCWDTTIKDLLKKQNINSLWLGEIYRDYPDGYRWVKKNFNKNIFKLWIYYIDKQELKTVVNKIINVELKGGNNNEN